MSHSSAKVINDLIICSFHTDDDYYTAAGDRLRASLDALGLPHEIASISADGADWIDICRKKVPFLHRVCVKHPDKKVFWIDGDCELDHLPDFIRHSSADVIGFQRGFSTPLKMGYANFTRFWEPCFWGIGTSPAARAYIATACDAEARITVRATDDFFFEEAWRVHAEKLTFQIIPSGAVAGKSDQVAPFFIFGNSGNVATFRGQAQQHEGVMPTAPKPALQPQTTPQTAPQTALPGPRAPAKPKGPPLSLVGRAQRKLRRMMLGPEPVQNAPAPTKPTDPAQSVTLQTGPAQAGPAQAGPAQAGPAQAGPAQAGPAQAGNVRAGPRTAAQKAIQTAMVSARKGNRKKAEATIEEMQTRSLLTAFQSNAVIAARSFLDYTAAPSDKKIQLVWWEKPYPGNFGDWLSPLIFHRTSGGRKVMFSAPNGKAAVPHIVGVGSIGRFVNDLSVVAGSGVSRLDTPLNTKARYVSVRGPITAQVLKEAGGPDVTSFGDPGILMPRVMPIARGATNGRIALVRHYAHRKLFLKLPDTMDEHNIMMSDAKTIEAFITTLIGYEAVVTSAMHIYIVCQSYGIPCALVTFAGGEDMVHGDGLKYIDYARGVGVPEAAPAVIGLDLRTRDFDTLITDHRVSQSKMDEVQEALYLAVKLYDEQAT